MALTPLYHAWADLLTAARVKSLRAKALIIALKTAIKRLENQDRSVSRYVSLWFLSSLSLNPRDFDQNLQRVAYGIVVQYKLLLELGSNG